MPEFSEFRPPTHDTLADLAVPSGAGERTVYGIEYAQILGFRPLRMDVHIPVGAEPHPVVLYFHGGAFMMGSRRENWVAAPLWRALLDAGIAVASVEYRLSGEATFPACVNDASAAVRWLSTYGEGLGLNPDAIGVIGESAGGYLSAFVAMNSTDPLIVGGDGVAGSSAVRAAVAWYPPTDFARMDQHATVPGSMVHGSADSPESRLVGEAVARGSDAVLFASPIEHVSSGAAPILLLHGEADRAVPSKQSVALAERLRDAGATVEVEIIPAADHVFEGVDREPIIRRSVEFLARHLRDH